MTQRRKLERYDLSRMNVPEAFWYAKIQNVAESVRPAVTRYLTKLDEMVPRGVGLLITGPSGVGKTAIAALVAKEARSCGFTVYFTTMREILDGEKENILFDGEMSLMRRARGVDVLVLDNIGVDELDKSWDSRASKIALEELCKWRAEHRKVTVLTTQISTHADLRAKLPTLAGAIEETIVPLAVVGPDQRAEQKIEIRRLVLGD